MHTWHLIALHHLHGEAGMYATRIVEGDTARCCAAGHPVRRQACGPVGAPVRAYHMYLQKVPKVIGSYTTTLLVV